MPIVNREAVLHHSSNFTVIGSLVKSDGGLKTGVGDVDVFAQPAAEFSHVIEEDVAQVGIFEDVMINSQVHGNVTVDMDAEVVSLPAHGGLDDEVEVGGNSWSLGFSTGSSGLQWEIHRFRHSDFVSATMVVDVLAERLQLMPAISSFCSESVPATGTNLGPLIV